MRVQLLSDLHLERHPDFLPAAVPEVDVLVLAGDIGSYQAGSALVDEDFGLGRFSPKRPGSPWPTVLFVPGNHEYDDLDYRTTHARLQEICERLGIVWLERVTHVMGHVRFVGTTLWSDFDALAADARDLRQQLQQRDKAYRAANYYLRKHTTFLDGAPLLAEGMRELSLQCQAWLRAELCKPFDGTTVAVTHFAPTLDSADPRYGRTPGTAGFCNGLDDLLPHAQLWLHGHLHCRNDYLVQTPSGTCRVLANPWGYASKNEQLDFRPELYVDL